MHIKKTKSVESATNTCNISAKPSIDTGRPHAKRTGTIKPDGKIESSCSTKKKPRTKTQASCSSKRKPKKVESVATLRGSRKNPYREAEVHIKSAIDIMCGSDIKDESTKEIVANMAVILMDLQSKK